MVMKPQVSDSCDAVVLVQTVCVWIKREQNEWYEMKGSREDVGIFFFFLKNIGKNTVCDHI